MEIDPIEMMAFCIALLDHLGGLAEPLPGLDHAAATAALPDLADAVGQLGGDPAAIDENIEELRPIVDGMPAEDLQEGAAYCLEMAQEL